MAVTVELLANDLEPIGETLKRLLTSFGYARPGCHGVFYNRPGSGSWFPISKPIISDSTWLRHVKRDR